MKNFLLYLFLTLMLIFLYTELSHFWVSSGGINGQNKYLELPILTIMLLVLYLPAKTALESTFLAAIPIVGLYVIFDIFYHFLARSPRFDDIQNAATLSDFSPLLSVGLFTMIILITIPVAYIFLRNTFSTTYYPLLFAKIIVLTSIIFYLNTSHFSSYLIKVFDYYSWSQARTIKKNGRFASSIYYNILSMQAKETLQSYKNRDISINKLLFDSLVIENKRNIHIIILESFIDPRLIKDISFSQSPMSENMKNYLNDDEFSYIVSSVYGGGTAQSEFEVLTAIPALSKVSSIEFNSMEGNQISGFVNLLKQNGYNTFTSIATYSGYYNSKEAYKSIGFDEINFLEESEDFQSEPDDTRIFDGDIYAYNLQQIKQSSSEAPYLHYTLGMYGHFPYDRNIAIRPDKIFTAYDDNRMQRIGNQFFYRTKALAKYMDEIHLLDPYAIIFVASDHLPPLLTNGIEYTREPTDNIALLYANGEAIDINGMHYYDVPRIIWNLLNNKNPTELTDIDDRLYNDIYFKALSESLK